MINSQMTKPQIAQTADDVRSGATTARSLVEDAIRRHEDSDLDAYIVFDAEGARRQADAVDAAVARGKDPGPLAGVTVSVKDLYGVDDLPIRAGTKRELPERWRTEGFLVTTLRLMGAVVVGKTHTVELAFGGVGVNPNTGTPVNPWDASEHRVPGGSSSGAGVSLWESSAMLALGTDTGGSVRIPASATGTVGMRHTTGRWPADGVVPLSTTLDTVGFLTHTVRDTGHVFRLIDRHMHGSNIGNEWGDTLDTPRIGVMEGGAWASCAPDIAAALHGALAELERVGAQLVPFEAPELWEAADRYVAGGLVQPERYESLERHLPGWTPLLDPTVGKRLEAPEISAVDYIAQLRLRRRLSHQLHRRMLDAKIELLATPTLTIAPPTLASLEELDTYRAVNRTMLYVTGAASMLDMCAISLPVGLDKGGMPVGLQLIGASDRDHGLLARAEVIEHLLGTNRERLGTPPRL